MFEVGDRVKMAATVKNQLRLNGCSEHVEEFGDCVGVVEGPVDYGNGVIGPELDVRWEPSRLRYAYSPEHLESVE